MSKSIIETVQSLKGIEDKKNFLREFSKSYAKVLEGKEITKPDGTVKPMGINDLLVLAYAREGATNLKTFNQWKKDGYNVKKGAKSLILWSALIIKGDQEGEQAQKFFKIAFVFAENDVEPLNN
jgi:N-terminal domain of anti-restriction factor ArdC